MSVTIYVRTDRTDRPEVNMSNVNARFVFDALGIVGDDVYCGTMSGDELLGRVLVAEALAPEDEGIPVHEREARATFIDCGRAPGYLQERLAQVHDIAEHAACEGLQVGWC